MIETKKRFVPKWRDAMGNVIVLGYLDTNFATEAEALAWAGVKGWPLMMLGFTYIGAMPIEITLDGKFVLDHAPCTVGEQFEAFLIAGPLFDSAPKIPHVNH